MPQLFQVLRCYKCSVFQVHQTKKSIKWECKLCGEKQSIKRHYGLGTGKECRLHVQKLNGLRGEIDELSETMKPHIDSDEEVESQYLRKETNQEKKFLFDKSPQVKKESKWSDFVEKTENVPEPDCNETMYLGNTEVVLEVPAKRRKFIKPRVIHKETDLNAQEGKSNNVDKVNDFKDCRYIKTNAFPEPLLTMASNSRNLSMHSESQNDFTIRNGKSIPSESQNDFTIRNGKSIPSESQNDFTIRNGKNFDILTSSGEVLSLSKNVETISCQVQKKEKFVLPKVSKNSKWAQFTEDDKDENEPLSKIEETHTQNIRNNLFSLCDENDLDDVLNL